MEETHFSCPILCLLGKSQLHGIMVGAQFGSELSVEEVGLTCGRF